MPAILLNGKAEKSVEESKNVAMLFLLEQKTKDD